MKVTLEFNLPKEQEAFDAARCGSDSLLLIRSLLHEFSNLRRRGTGAFQNCDIDSINAVSLWIAEHLRDYDLPTT
jgi:hypothetical protein